MRIAKRYMLSSGLLVWAICFLYPCSFFPQTAPQSTPSRAEKTTAARPSTTKAANKKVLTVDDVISMVQSGLSEELIIVSLRRANLIFDLSADEMVKLKKAGVSERIIMVMLDPKAEAKSAPSALPSQPPSPLAPAAVPRENFFGGPAGSPQAAQTSPPAPPTLVTIPSPIYPAVVTGANPSGATPAPGTPNAVIAAGESNPDAPHDSGIYWYTETKSGEKKMTVLERASYQGGKSGGFFTSAMTMGIAKMKWKAMLSGPRATLQIADTSPVFYFYFEEKSAGLGKSYFGLQSISNPNQFALIKLNVKSTTRETIVMEMGAFGGSSGTHEKSMIPFKVERLRPGVYRVTPTTAMEPGEYCFLASSFGGGMMGTGGAATAADIFDFSIPRID